MQELSLIGIDPSKVIDFSANQSPLGPSPSVVKAMANAIISCYPDRDALPLAAAIAEYHNLLPDQVVVGNGSTEIIRLVAQLALRPGDCAIAPTNTFGEYRIATLLAGADYHTVGGNTFDDALPAFIPAIAHLQPRVCWLCLPNNPTGMGAQPSEIATLIHVYPEVIFVLDEAYCDLLSEPQWQPDLLSRGNLIVLRSMTKSMGLAGLRLGYALGGTSLMNTLRMAKPPWNVNDCAQKAGIAALADSEHYAKTIAMLRQEKQKLIDGITGHGWQVVPSAAAFFLVYVGNAAVLTRQFLEYGCLVRDCTSFGLPQYIRVSPRYPDQNLQLLTAFGQLKPWPAKEE